MSLDAWGMQGFKEGMVRYQERTGRMHGFEEGRVGIKSGLAGKNKEASKKE